MTRRQAMMACAAAFIAMAGARAQEDKFPSHPITVVIGSSAGSAVDLEIRVLDEWFRNNTGQPLNVDLRPGAMGGIGATAVYRAKPDGYTMLMSPASPMVFNPVTHKNLTYDPAKMTPIIEVAEQPLVLVTRGDFPGETVADLIAYAKAHPGKTYYSSPGIGGGNHMSVLLFAKYAGIDVKHVPYDGAAPATQALLKGEVDFGIISASSLLPWYRDKKLKFLAIGSQKRYAEAPDVPTWLELGYPQEFVLTAWRVLAGPPNVPAPIVNTLNGLLNKALADQTVIQKFKQLGLEVSGGSPQDVAAMLAREAATWERVARENNIEKE